MKINPELDVDMDWMPDNAFDATKEQVGKMRSQYVKRFSEDSTITLDKFLDELFEKKYRNRKRPWEA